MRSSSTTVADISAEFEGNLAFPGSLANEVVDLQINELKSELKMKVRISLPIAIAVLCMICIDIL